MSLEIFPVWPMTNVRNNFRNRSIWRCHRYQNRKNNKVGGGQLKEIAAGQFGDFIKAVVDVEREIMAVGSELHADAEALLLERGNRQEDLWGGGLNLYPEKSDEERIRGLVRTAPAALFHRQRAPLPYGPDGPFLLCKRVWAVVLYILLII